MIMAVLGFLAPFIPDVMGMFKAGQDHKHEMAMMKLRAEQAKDEHLWRVEEITVKADLEDMKAARKPHQSYGVQILDKAHEAQGIVWRWSFNLIFIMFAVLDWLISSVRPGVTYWIFGIYASVKTATVAALYRNATKFSEGGWDALVAALNNQAVFGPFDQDILTLVLSFWFGQRLRQRPNGK